MSKILLQQEIIALSESSIWSEAKDEWEVESIYKVSEPQTCLCGHYPIIEICSLQNLKNGNTATVGNTCVNKFMGLFSDKIFQAVKRIQKDNTKSLNKEAIKYAYTKKWITDWENDFYKDTMFKRNLSLKQAKKRIIINKKILLKINLISS